MASQKLQEAVRSYDKYLLTDGTDKRSLRKRAFEEQTMNAYTAACRVAIETEKDIEYGLKLTKRVKNMLNDFAVSKGYRDIFHLERVYKAKDESMLPSPVKYYYDVLYLESYYLFDSYMLYLEKNRDYTRKFYEPRRKCLLKTGIVQGLQDLADDKLDILSISMPPSTGKTTIEKFFQSWIIGRFPEESNLFFSHSGEITRMYYDGVYDITTSNEYTWQEIFPEVKITSTNAKSEQINFGAYKQHANVQCTSIGSSNAGKVRVSPRGYLLVDDIIGGIEVALNKNQLDKLWEIYTVDARQRKMDGAKEIHISTRWSVHDCIGRLKTTFEGNDRARFIAVPDIDPETGESNFLYDLNGFTVEFFNDQAMLMDDISYRCLYKNEPIEREGLLYHEEDIRTFLELPEGEPDAILSVCDTKNKGSDFLVCPVCFVYGADHYLVDTICTDSADYGVQYGRLAALLVDNNVQQCEFEANNGGDRVAYEVEDRIQNMGARCNITTKPTETNKETRIIVNADWVKKNVLFKDKSKYTPNSDYGVFMKWLFSYSVSGKNVHDDVPDCMANYALFITRKLGAVVTVTSRFF